MRWWRFVLLFLFFGLNRAEAAGVSGADGFPYPKIPQMIQTPAERRGYLLQHYWDAFDMARLSKNREIGEQGLVNFFYLMSASGVSDEARATAMRNFCRKILSIRSARSVFEQWTDEYLNYPNSPLFNEALYRFYLQAMLAELPSKDPVRSAFEFRLALINKNRVGTVATDFTYRNLAGETKSLRSTPVKGNRLLLVFYDPDCEHCHATVRKMAADKNLTQAVQSGRLTVLAIYTEGDISLWKRTAGTMPRGWIVGYDGGKVREQLLYDLKALPTIYFLDGKKKVLVKDVRYSFMTFRNLLTM